LYGGIFPVAKLDLARALQSSSDLSFTKLEVNSDCSETIVMGHEARGKFVTRLDSSVLSRLVFKSPSVLPFFKVLPQMEYTLAYLDKQVATCKREWTKFHGKLNANLRVLADKITERQERHRKSATSVFQRENPLCSELVAFASHSQMSEELY
jgi:hypothetical protein